MDRLGLNDADFKAWQSTLLRPHDAGTRVEVLDMDGGLIGPLPLLEGGIDVDGDATTTQSLTATLLDEAGFLDGLALNRQLRVTYLVTVPSLGRVVPCGMFVGPIVRPPNHSRLEVSVECQDRSAIAMRGVPPKTYPVGKVVATIQQILSEKCGQRIFRFPTSGAKFDERMEDPVTVGWEDEVLPWIQCQELARSIDMQLFFDGMACVLRDYPSDPVMDLTDFVTGRPADEAPSEIVNRFKVVGKRPKDHTVVLTLPPEHDASPESLNVGGVPQYFSVEEANSKLNTVAKVRARASRLRAQYEAGLVERRGLDIVPVPNLHPLDMVTVDADLHRLRRWSFPLTASGDMTVGYNAPVGRS